MKCVLTRKDFLPPDEVQHCFACASEPEGQVWVGFVILETGYVDKKSVEVISGIDTACNREAIRIIQNSPKWCPGGMISTMEDVPVKMKIAVDFILPKS